MYLRGKHSFFAEITFMKIYVYGTDCSYIPDETLPSMKYIETLEGGTGSPWFFLFRRVTYSHRRKIT